jgi:hypothetical protein
MKYQAKVGSQTYTAELQPARGGDPQRWVEFRAPSQKAATLYIPLDLVLAIAQQLPTEQMLMSPLRVQEIK